jgi:hypothetical protein
MIFRSTTIDELDLLQCVIFIAHATQQHQTVQIAIREHTTASLHGYWHPQSETHPQQLSLPTIRISISPYFSLISPACRSPQTRTVYFNRHAHHAGQDQAVSGVLAHVLSREWESKASKVIDCSSDSNGRVRPK